MGTLSLEHLMRPRGLSRPEVGLGLIVGSFGIVALGVIGWYNPWSLVWVDRLLGHVFVLGVLAALVCGLGVALIGWRSTWGKVGAIVSGLVALCWATIGLVVAVVFSTFAPEELAVVRAPQTLDGRDYEAVLRTDSGGLIDPAWTISIRQRGGPLAHEWRACYVEENPEVEHIYWESRRRLVVVTSQGEHRLAVNPRDGFPAEDQPVELCR